MTHTPAPAPAPARDALAREVAVGVVAQLAAREVVRQVAAHSARRLREQRARRFALLLRTQGLASASGQVTRSRDLAV